MLDKTSESLLKYLNNKYKCGTHVIEKFEDLANETASLAYFKNRPVYAKEKHDSLGNLKSLGFIKSVDDIYPMHSIELTYTGIKHLELERRKWLWSVIIPSSITIVINIFIIIIKVYI